MKKVTQIIKEAENAVPINKDRKLLTNPDLWQIMEQRQKWIRDNYGSMPTLNDED